MTTSSANVYDSIEEQTETFHSDALSLQSYVVIFRPSTGNWKGCPDIARF